MQPHWKSALIRRMGSVLLLTTILALIYPNHAAALFESEVRQYPEMEKEIQGFWQAAEYYMALPPQELQQSIKSISFSTGNIVEWEYVHEGKMHKTRGRYGIYSFSEDQSPSRRSLHLVAVPVDSPDPLDTDHKLLDLFDLELDFDARFLKSWGKLLKAIGPDGKRLLFIKAEKTRE
jgi:hypothetical protein